MLLLKEGMQEISEEPGMDVWCLLQKDKEDFNRIYA